RFFETKTFLFVFSLSAAIGCAYYAIFLLLAPLEELNINSQQLFDASMLQTFYVGLSWSILKRMRGKVEKNEE
ncbi:MAG: hypothetical protein IK079_05645, partial [Desulfovibrio sp.]|nr:hypothetical protein [Desulfovibrio sp.]